MQEENLENFLSQFGEDFYNGENAFRQAFRRRSCFNHIQYGTSFKVDVFITRERPLDQSCMQLADQAKLEYDTKSIVVPMATEEDFMSITFRSLTRYLVSRILYFGYSAHEWLSIQIRPLFIFVALPNLAAKEIENPDSLRRKL